MNTYILSFAILILVAVQPVISQNKPNENFLLKRFESDIAFDYLQEFSTAFLSYVEKMDSRGKSKVAIRFCSESPMKIAVTRGAIDLTAIYSVFNGYGFPPSDIIILRSSECVSKVNVISATEIWVINDENNLPPFSERLSSNEIRTLEIGGSIVRFVGNGNYLNNAKTLASKLGKDERAFGVVYIAYKTTNTIGAKLFRKKIVDIFTQAGINQSRYAVEIIRWNSKLSVEPLGKRTIFPDFHLVTSKA